MGFGEAGSPLRQPPADPPHYTAWRYFPHPSHKKKNIKKNKLSQDRAETLTDSVCFIFIYKFKGST